MRKTLTFFAAVCALGAAFADISGEELAKRQARSVHLRFEPTVPNAAAVRGTVTVTETQTNTYYCIYGWDCGYCGIQDLGKDSAGNDRRILIFSVWDPIDHEAVAAMSEEEKANLSAKVLYARDGVEVSRFGGEGTGAKTMTQIGWKVGEPVTVVVTAEPDGADRTAYTCWYKDGKKGKRTKLASISTLANAARARGINGIYCFIEDFWRNYYSATLSRRAVFSNYATRAAGSKEWVKATRADFTGDGTPSNAVDAGSEGPYAFFLKTGGTTTNEHVKLWGKVISEPPETTGAKN